MSIIDIVVNIQKEFNMKAKTKIAAVITTATALSFMLTSCAIIPVMDGRSPFDSPFGVSQKQIKNAIPPLQEKLDKVDQEFDKDEQWDIIAEKKAGNCEGECKLELRISIKPSEKQLNAIMQDPNWEMEALDESELSLYKKEYSYDLKVSFPVEFEEALDKIAIETEAKTKIPTRTLGSYTFAPNDENKRFTLKGEKDENELFDSRTHYEQVIFKTELKSGH